MAEYSRRRLPVSFLARPTLEVARDLLGRLLIRRLQDRRLVVCRLVETEAYVGETDLACHAARGRTPRNEVLYESAGVIYVYLNYGIHWMFNLVTERAGFPSAVLVRGAEVVTGHGAVRARRPGRSDPELLRGPGNLTRGLDLDGSANRGRIGEDGVWLACGQPVADAEVVATPRVGVDYAGASRDLPWRFIVAGSAAASGRRPRRR